MPTQDRGSQHQWSAGEIVDLLGRLEVRPLSAEEQRALSARWSLFEQLERPKLAVHDCPQCGADEVDPADATWHVARCERHPARLRYEQLARLAARLSQRAGQPNDLEPQPLAFPDREDHLLIWVEFPQAVARLASPDASAGSRADAAWSIRRQLRWRLFAAERASDPCPWCHGVFPLETFHQHLWTCAQHPATARGATLAEALERRFGAAQVTEALGEDRQLAAQAALKALVGACQKYAAGMGYFGPGTYYSKKWIERPWLREVHLAASFARDEGRRPMTPALAQVVSATATLTEQCWSFWNGMGDDGDGRSLIIDDDCRAWEAQVSAADPERSAR